MGCELGKITLYMSKAKKTFKDVVDKTKVSEKDTSNFKVRTFKVDGVGCKFYCQQVINNTGENPPWLDFVNESLDDDKTVEFQPKPWLAVFLTVLSLSRKTYLDATT